MIRVLSVNPRIFVVGALFVLGGLILALAGRAYLVQSQARIVHDPVEQREDAELALRELETLFEPQTAAGQRYAAIAERNLFTPDRRAWVPPPQESDPAPEPAPVEAPPPPPGLRNVRLYGTQITSEGGAALLYFGSFSSKNKHRLVREGEMARDEGDRQVFQVVRVSRDSVTLSDSHDREFEVGLFDHQRVVAESPSAPVAQPSVQVGGGTAPAPDPVQTVEDPPAAAAEQAAPEAPPRAQMLPFGQQPDEEMERLVEQGTMRRINTPFGTIYRPVQ